MSVPHEHEHHRSPFTEHDVLEEIARVASEELDRDAPVEPDARIVDLDLDSLSMTVLAVALEDRFRVRLRPDDDAPTLRDLARLVVRRASEEAP